MKKHYTIVKELLDAGAAVNKGDLHGRTPLHFAARGRLKRFPKLLLDKGADPNIKAAAGVRGVAPLHEAATLGEKGVVKYLIKRGAEVDKEDDRGWTPLRVALEVVNKEAAKMLLDLGADPTKPDNKGVTPESFARHWRPNYCPCWFTKLTEESARRHHNQIL